MPYVTIKQLFKKKKRLVSLKFKLEKILDKHLEKNKKEKNGKFSIRCIKVCQINPAIINYRHSG